MKLAALRSFALALPAVTEEPHHHFGSFRVGGKIFITLPPGEGVIHVFVDEAQREQALAMYPSFVEKLFWGGKVVGLRVILALAQPAVVKALVKQAYERKAQPSARKRPQT